VRPPAMSKRKILCLHGIGTSGEVGKERLTRRLMLRPNKSRAQILKWQLGGLVTRLEAEQGFEFHFVDGPLNSPGHEEVLGLSPGPFYRWFSWTAPNPSAEDRESVKEAIRLLYTCIADEGPFEGILGFSQGATLAYGFLQHHANQNPLAPAHDLFRFAILFSAPGLAKIRGVNDGAAKVGVPSLHICGRADPWERESLSLVELCECGSATVIRHSLGHTIPRDRATVSMIVDAVEKLQHNAGGF